MTNTTIISLYYPILLCFSFSLVLPTMINLFKKNIHSLLSLALHATTSECDPHLQFQHEQPLGLVTATKDVDRPPNVLESATLKHNNGNVSVDVNAPPPSTSSSRAEFVDEIGGGVDGLTSCTESLGCESSDERRVDDHRQMEEINGDSRSDDEIWRRKRGSWRKVRSFPPPLSSLNRNGKPSFFLRPVRKDGRLELTEVRIHRPEILHASRHDGRLTLHLIPDQSILEEEEEIEEEMVSDEEEEFEEIRSDEEEKEERVNAEWKFPIGGKKNHEGIRKCYEMVNQHHHHHHVHANHHHLRMCGISIV